MCCHTTSTFWRRCNNTRIHQQDVTVLVSTNDEAVGRIADAGESPSFEG